MKSNIRVGKTPTSTRGSSKSSVMSARITPPAAPDNEGQATTLVVPPDGGWGWVVMMAAFGCNFVTDGVISSFGIYMRVISEEFHVTNGAVSLVGSLLTGFMQITGPLVSGLTNKYGFRKVAFAGGVTSTTGLALSYLAPSVTVLYLTYGVLGGIGMGLLYVPAVLVVNFYFARWRALTSCVAMVGGGLGGSVTPIVIKTLIDNIGWRSTLLLQAGMMSTTCLLSLLFRPLQPVSVYTKLPARDVTRVVLHAQSQDSILSRSPPPGPSTVTNVSKRKRVSMGMSNSAYPTFLEVVNGSIVTFEPSIASKPLKSLQLLPGLMVDTSSETIEVLNLDRLNSMASLQIPADRAKPAEQRCVRWCGLVSRARPKCRRRLARESVVSARPLYRDDIFYDQSLQRLQQYTSQQGGSLNDADYHLAVTRVTTAKDLQQDQSAKVVVCSEALRRTLATMLDLSPLRSLPFLLYIVASSLLSSVYYVPHMYMPERARLNGVDPTITALFATTISMSQLAARIVCGLVASLPFVDPYIIVNISSGASGVSMILSNLSITVVHQISCCVLYGAALACNSNMRTVILVELLGLDKLTNAFGLVLMLQGVSSMLGPPLAGWMKELMGSYDAVFYFSGTVALLACVITLPLTYLGRRKRSTMSHLAS